MRKKINKAGSGLMLMMLTCNTVAPSASLVYAETTKPNIQLSLNSLAPEVYAGESAVYRLDFKVSGAMEEVNEQLNNAKSRQVVIQLPEETAFYSMPSDEAYLKTLAISSLDKDGNKVETIPTYDQENHQLIYEFSSLRAGTSSMVFLKLDTKNGVTPNNTEMALSAKFAAGEEELASTKATTKIKAQLPIAVTKSFDGVLDEDGNIQEDVLAARSGDEVQWSVRVEVPTTEMGMSLIKDGAPVIVKDVLDDNLSYVNAKGEEVTVIQNGQTVNFSFPTKTRDEQLKLLADGKSLFVREFTLITKVKEGITEYTKIPNTVTATVTAKEDTTVNGTSNTPKMVVTTDGGESSQVNGDILYPVFYGPKNGNGEHNFDWNNLDSNPTVKDTAQLSFYNQYHVMPGKNDPNQNDSDEEVKDTNGNYFDWKNNVYNILEKGYQEINLNYTLDKKMTFENVLINKPVLEYCDDPAEVYPHEFVMNIIVILDDGTERTIKVDFDKLSEDRRPNYQSVLYNREKLGLTESEKVSKYTISLTPTEGQMIDGRTSVLVQPHYGIVPDSKGEATATVSYDAVLYDGTAVTRTAGGAGNAANIGPRRVTIAEDKVSIPTITADLNFLEKDGSLVEVGDNRLNFTVTNMAASGTALKGNPIVGNVLLPKGVYIKEDAKATYQFINRSGQVATPTADYTVIDNYKNTGQQLVQVQWKRDRINPTETLTFDFDVEVTKDAAYHLDMEGYVLSENDGLNVPKGDEFQYIEVEKEDTDDMDSDGVTDEQRVKLNRTYVLQSKKDLQTIKLVKGDLDTDYSYLGKASLGGEIDYRITMTNTTTDNITKLGFIDILPSKDDKTVLDNVARGSKFTPTLKEAIAVPEKWMNKVEIFYSTAKNPKRDTVLDKVDYPTEVEGITNPTEVTDPAWKKAADIKDWSSIHSFKIELKPGTVMIPGQDITLNFKMQAPTELSDELLDVNTDGKDRAAWNSFAMTTNGLLPIEPQRVGVYVEASGIVKAEYYIEGTNIKLPLPDGATEKVVMDDLIGKAYSDQAVPERLTATDGKTYALVKVDDKPTLKDGSAAQTGNVRFKQQTIQYQYKEVFGDVVVNYKDKDGNVIKNPVEDTTDSSTGTNYDTTDNKPEIIKTNDGKMYKIIPTETIGNETGKVKEGKTEVTYIYEEVVGDVVVHYKDEDGNVIKEPVIDTKDVTPGEKYDTTDHKPQTITTEDGKKYELVPSKTIGAEDGEVKEGTTDVTYVYKEVPVITGDVIVKYHDEDGNPIKAQVTDTKDALTETPYDTTDNKPQTITTEDGTTYELVPEKNPENETGSVVEGTTEVIYVYKKVSDPEVPNGAKGNVVVNYVTEDGLVIKAQVEDTKPSTPGTEYNTEDNKPTTITTEDGTKYILVPEKTEGHENGVVIEGTTEITYVYKEVPAPKGNVIVNYEDVNGNIIKVQVEDTPNTDVDTPYDTTDNKPTIITKDGKTYELVEDKTKGTEEGKVVAGTTEVTYVYQEVISEDKEVSPKGNVIVNYEDVDGNIIKVQVEDTPTSDVGTEYNTKDNKPTTITTADGKTYELVEDETKGKETGEVKEGTTEVTYVYQEVLAPKGNVIVNYEDVNGNIIKTQVEDTPISSVGTEYSTTDNKPVTITTADGKKYILVEDKTKGEETGKVKEGTTEVTYVYQEVVGDVLVHYVDEEGNVIQAPVVDTTPISVGTAYDTTDRKPTTIITPDGTTYELVPEKDPENETGSVIAGTTDVTYVYKKVEEILPTPAEKTGNVIVHYQDEAGNIIKLPVEDTKPSAPGTAYDTTDNKPTTITTEDGRKFTLVPAKTIGTENGEVVEGTTDITYIYKEVTPVEPLPENPTGNVVVNYVDEEGNVIKAQVEDTTPSEVGTAYDTTDNKPTTITTEDGRQFELVPEKTEGNENGSVVEGTTQITYVYKEKVSDDQEVTPKGNVIVNYQTEDGKVIKAQVEDTTPSEVGTAYDTTDNKPTIIETEDGKMYEIIPSETIGNEEGEVVEGTTQITYIYKEINPKQNGNVIVNYEDEAGNVIKVPVIDTPFVVPGTDYDTTDHKPETIITADGRTYEIIPTETKGTENGQVVPGTTEVTYIYKEVLGDVIVHYVDEDGNTIKGDVIDTPLSSTKTAYDTTDNKPQMIVTEDGDIYFLVPTKTIGTEEGKVVPGTTEITYVYKKYIPSPKPTPDPVTPVDPTDPTDPVTPVDPTDPTDPVTPVDPTDPTDPVTPVNPTDPTIPENLKPGIDQGLVIVDYVDENGNVIKEPVIDTPITEIGTDYDTTDNKPTIIITENGNKYELVPEKTEGQETGQVTAGITEITYVYKLVEGSESIEGGSTLPTTGVRSVLGQVALASIFVTTGLAVLIKRKK